MVVNRGYTILFILHVFTTVINWKFGIIDPSFWHSYITDQKKKVTITEQCALVNQLPSFPYIYIQVYGKTDACAQKGRETRVYTTCRRASSLFSALESLMKAMPCCSNSILKSRRPQMDNTFEFLVNQLLHSLQEKRRKEEGQNTQKQIVKQDYTSEVSVLQTEENKRHWD